MDAKRNHLTLRSFLLPFGLSEQFVPARFSLSFSWCVKHFSELRISGSARVGLELVLM
jgi:hypothetical protein